MILPRALQMEYTCYTTDVYQIATRGITQGCKLEKSEPENRDTNTVWSRESFAALDVAFLLRVEKG